MFTASLFVSIVEGWAAAAKHLGTPAPSLNRFDLFHGHIFIARGCDNTAAPTQQGLQLDAGPRHAVLTSQQAHSTADTSSHSSNRHKQPALTVVNLEGSSSSSGSRSSSRGGTGRGKQRRLTLDAASCMGGSSSSSAVGCQVGVLFHASEYPAFDASSFPIMLGHCQANSSCKYNQRAMDLRNILWWQVRSRGLSALAMAAGYAASS